MVDNENNNEFKVKVREKRGREAKRAFFGGILEGNLNQLCTDVHQSSLEALMEVTIESLNGVVIRMALFVSTHLCQTLPIPQCDFRSTRDANLKGNKGFYRLNATPAREKCSAHLIRQPLPPPRRDSLTAVQLSEIFIIIRVAFHHGAFCQMSLSKTVEFESMQAIWRDDIL